MKITYRSLMTFAIFTRQHVVNPGWPQIMATLLVTIGTCATAFAMFGQFLKNPAGDILLRVLLAVFAFVTMFHPDGNMAIAAAAFALPATIYGVMRHRRIAPLTGAGDLRPVS